LYNIKGGKLLFLYSKILLNTIVRFNLGGSIGI
jgi:hypothetical protein